MWGGTGQKGCAVACSRVKVAGYAGVLIAGGALLIFHLRRDQNSIASETVPLCSISVADLSVFSVPAESAKAVAVSASSQEVSDEILKEVFSAMRGMFGFSSNEPPSLQERKLLFNVLFDAGAVYGERRKAAWRLARFADSEICGILKGFLNDPSQDSGLKALIAEGLGGSTCPQAKDMILSLLESGDVTEVCGAVRGLAMIGTPDEAARLTQLLASADTEPFVYDEIIEVLGKIPGAESYATLTDLYKQAVVAGNTDLAGKIIGSLAQKDISQTKDFFDSILSDPETDPDLRAVVAEAVSSAEGEKAPALIGLLSNPDPDVRAEVAWGLIEMGQSAETISAVFQTLEKEGDPLVRKNLYQALAVQDAGAVSLSDVTIDGIYKETVSAVKVSGYSLIANQLNGSENNTSLQQRFDEQAVPELLQIALTGKKTSERIQAVKVLEQAGTEKANEALLTVVSKSLDPRVINASGVDLVKLLDQ